MKLQFTKMHGLGNDFVVIDGISQTVALSAEQIRFLANRRFGVGFIQKPHSRGIDPLDLLHPCLTLSDHVWSKLLGGDQRFFCM